MSAGNIRSKRIKDQNNSHRDSEDEVIDKASSFEEWIQELAETLKRNNDMLDAIIKHLGVPYKPSARFVKV